MSEWVARSTAARHCLTWRGTRILIPSGSALGLLPAVACRRPVADPGSLRFRKARRSPWS
jgi:hypothetical protein